MTVPKRHVHAGELANVTLFGKRVSADVIKSRISRCDHPRFPGWAHKSKRPYDIYAEKRQGEEKAMCSQGLE